MKFLVDAQLPQHLAQVLTVAGHDALHTLDLPGANRRRDEKLADLAAQENRILITKDADFVTTFHLQHAHQSSYWSLLATLIMLPSCAWSSRILIIWYMRSPNMISWN